MSGTNISSRLAQLPKIEYTEDPALKNSMANASSNISEMAGSIFNMLLSLTVSAVESSSHDSDQKTQSLEASKQTLNAQTQKLLDAQKAKTDLYEQRINNALAVMDKEAQERIAIEQALADKKAQIQQEADFLREGTNPTDKDGNKRTFKGSVDKIDALNGEIEQLAIQSEGLAMQVRAQQGVVVDTQAEITTVAVDTQSKVTEQQTLAQKYTWQGQEVKQFNGNLQVQGGQLIAKGQAKQANPFGAGDGQQEIQAGTEAQSTATNNNTRVDSSILPELTTQIPGFLTQVTNSISHMTFSSDNANPFVAQAGDNADYLEQSSGNNMDVVETVTELTEEYAAIEEESEGEGDKNLLADNSDGVTNSKDPKDPEERQKEIVDEIVVATGSIA